MFMKILCNFEYVKKVEITKVGFINIFFEEEFLIKKLSSNIIATK